MSGCYKGDFSLGLILEEKGEGWQASSHSQNRVMTLTALAPRGGGHQV
jgi:hypothetical protein